MSTQLRWKILTLNGRFIYLFECYYLYDFEQRLLSNLYEVSFAARA